MSIRWIFRYSILWVPAVALIAAACASSSDSCACLSWPTPQVCDEPPVTAAAVSYMGTATAANQTAAAVTYPPLPTVGYVPTTPTPEPDPHTIAPPVPSGGTPRPSATFMPPDPNVFRTPTPVPPTPTRGPTGLPLFAARIALDGGACHYATVDGCQWQEIGREGARATGDLVVFLETWCSPEITARFEVSTGGILMLPRSE